MEKFKQILAEEILRFYNETMTEDTTIEEIIAEMNDDDEEMQVIYKAVQRWHEYQLEQNKEGAKDIAFEKDITKD